jgi:predicted transcriptional regulator YheO
MNHKEIATNALQRIIDKAGENSAEAGARILSLMPKDYLVDTDNIDFSHENGKFVMGNKVRWPIHPHALAQMSQKFGIPTRYTNGLLEEGEWGIDLLVKNFSELRDKRARGKTFLIRTVDGEVRGFLSNKYKIIDSDLILDSFAKAAANQGALIESFAASDTKWYIKAIMPRIFYPIGQDPMAFGISLTNSDFGSGKLQLTAYSLRLLCTNGLVGHNTFSRTHLGRRMLHSSFSERTRKLESKTEASKISDIVNDMMSAESLENRLEAIKEATKEKVNPSEALKVFRKKSYISKEEEEELRDLCVTGDITELPPGNNRWRISQSLSLLAKTKPADRAFELQQLGGKIIEEGKL